MKLFGSTNRMSFNTLKIRAALAEAGAEYELVSVDLPKGEHRTADFLAMNPHGKIPVLLDGSFALAESDAILWYVGEKYPEARLLPPADGSLAAAQQRARVLQWCDFASSALYAAYIEWSLGKGAEPEQQASAAVTGAVSKVDRALAVMQAVLGTREHLADAFSLADLSNAAILRTLKLKLLRDPTEGYDRVSAWYQRISARAAWRQVTRDD